jgi:hypothetical protein
MQTAWMWHNASSNGVMGAEIDYDERVIRWFDEPGCACAGSGNEQTFEDFLARGPRPVSPPDDVTQEMREALRKQGVGAS